jgi:hypothetical protein
MLEALKLCKEMCRVSLRRCPFPIGWLMKKEGFGETPLTTGLFEDRWD